MASGDRGFQDFVLLMPASLRDRAEEMASRESVSLNLFILMAIAEKVQRTQLEHCPEVAKRDGLQSAQDSYPNLLIH